MLTKKQVDIIRDWIKRGARDFKIIGKIVYRLDYMTGNLTEVVEINLKKRLKPEDNNKRGIRLKEAGDS